MSGGTNKSNYVIDAFCGKLVRVGRFDAFVVDFLKRGHTKTRADKLFARVANSAKDQDYFNH